MRVLVNVEMDTAKGNEILQAGRIGEVMEGILGTLRPEASYFYARNGHRAFTLVVDAADSASLPGICEPFWQQLDARVEVLACMNADELGEGIRRLG